ncbi:hypothetical protein DOQ08_01456 [Marinobacter litoralis]|uniref:Uncharacterized protein n=1 Tax=Marinobacter litoralis TaxID=187981 RepID=A0A3M2RFP2_9GAMM|nr:hypothetical protein [Marinobacter litoralis]RMJ04136.1 hypothetical protein DOQ08_01456 [Marinobacter litoralis]
MTSDDSENKTPGTASPAKFRKAGCGIRFEEDELQEGIDFSNATHLKPVDDEAEQAPTAPPAKAQSASEENR